MRLWRKLQRLSLSFGLRTLFAVSASDHSHFDNFFRLFDLPEQFPVDTARLESQYKTLQAQYHPDKVAGGEDAERLQAIQKTSLVNDGYDTLKSPLRRAAYLLKRQGVDPEEHNQAHFGEDFLMHQLMLREELETLFASEDMDGLEGLKRQVGQDRDAALDRFQAQFDQQDFPGAKRTYNQMQFLDKLLTEIDTVEEKLLDY